MRINKLLSNYGVCSRKEANRIIEEGRVIVNGELAFPGQWVEEYDDILLDGEKLKPKERIYIALNKPVGITCTAANDVEDNIIQYMNYPEYIFPVGKELDNKFIEGMSNGVDIGGVITRPCKVSRVNDKTFNIILTQGLNKQIRRMSKAFGFNVVRLERVRIMNIKIDGIEYGKWRKLTEDEISVLREHAK